MRLSLNMFTLIVLSDLSIVGQTFNLIVNNKVQWLPDENRCSASHPFVARCQFFVNRRDLTPSYALSLMDISTQIESVLSVISFIVLFQMQ